MGLMRSALVRDLLKYSNVNVNFALKEPNYIWPDFTSHVILSEILIFKLLLIILLYLPSYSRGPVLCFIHFSFMYNSSALWRSWNQFCANTCRL